MSAWNFVNDAWIFRARVVFSDSSRRTSVASFLSSLVEPGRHALGIHAKGNSVEPLDGGLLLRPVEGSGHVGLDGALGGGVEALERRHDLAAWEDLDPEPPASHLLDNLPKPFGGALHDERAGPGRGHAPLDFGLRDDIRGVDDGRGPGGPQHAARLHDESASFHSDGLLHAGGRVSFMASRCLVTRPRAGGRRLRRCDPTAPRAPGTS